MRRFEYFYGEQADQFNFIRIPRALIIDAAFAVLSAPAKLLYAVLLDRMSLSLRNGWLDEEKRAYIIYQISDIQKDLGFSKRKAMDYLTELEEFGLVEKQKRGFGLPSILYVKSFLNVIEEADASDSEEKDDNDDRDTETDASRSAHTDTSGDEKINTSRGAQINTSRGAQIDTSRGAQIDTSRGAQIDTSRGAQIDTSRGAQIDTSEVTKSTPLNSYTKENKTNMSNTILSHHISTQESDAMRWDREYAAYQNLIRENIAYDVLLVDYKNHKELVNGIYELILETVLTQSETILIASERYPSSLVKSKFMKLNMFHVKYVIDCFEKNTTQVKNIKKYLLAALFNAPTTISGYYAAAVNYDMANYVG